MSHFAIYLHLLTDLIFWLYIVRGVSPHGFMPLIDLNNTHFAKNTRIYKVNINILSDSLYEIKGFLKNSAPKCEYSVKKTIHTPFCL